MVVASVTVPGSVADRYALLLELLAALQWARTSGELFSTLLDSLTRGLAATSAAVVLDAAPASREQTRSETYRTGARPIELTADAEQTLRAGGRVREQRADRTALLAVPLTRDAAYLGWIAVVRAAPPAFESADAEFMAAAARVAALALQALHHVNEADRLRGEAEQLQAVAKKLSESLELVDVVDRIASSACEIGGAPTVLWMVDDTRNRAVARAGGAVARLGEEQLADNAAPHVLSADAAGDIELPAGAERATLPLTVGSRKVGFLVLGPWREGVPGPERLQLLLRMAPYAASALENARLHAEVRRLSLTDPLVHLPNRRQFDLFLEREFAAAERGRDLAVVLFDLDRFKQYNDTHGHPAGDKALIAFASVLRTETRAMNLPARYGGEEFATVLSGTGIDGAIAHAERVRQKLIEVMGGTLTVSAGVAAWHEGMTSPAELVAAADRALYRAKIEGRNRVNVAPG